MSKKNQHEKRNAHRHTQTNKQKKRENVALKFDVRIFAFVS